MINIYKGDNLKVMEKLLKKKYLDKKPNIAYVDPPYFTNNSSLSYNDNFESMDIWTKFFKERLTLLNDVLDKDSFIAVSISEKTLAHAIICLDYVFGESNKISVMQRVTQNVSKTTKTISRIADFILLYKKGKVELNGIGIDESSYRKTDEHFQERGHYQLRRLDYKDFKYSSTMDTRILLNERVFTPGPDGSYDARKNGLSNDKDWCWIWSDRMIQFAINNDFIEEKNGFLYKKTYTKCKIKKTNGNYELIFGKRTKPLNSLHFTHKKYQNNNHRCEKAKLFTYKKSQVMMKDLIELPMFEEKRVIDIFAGSGTTGVICNNLNINCDLIQIDEVLKKTDDIYKLGYKNLFDYTVAILEEEVGKRNLKVIRRI